MVEKILNNTTPYGKIRASHEGSLHSSTLSSTSYNTFQLYSNYFAYPLETLQRWGKDEPYIYTHMVFPFMKSWRIFVKSLWTGQGICFIIHNRHYD